MFLLSFCLWARNDATTAVTSGPLGLCYSYLLFIFLDLLALGGDTLFIVSCFAVAARRYTFPG